MNKVYRRTALLLLMMIVLLAGFPVMTAYGADSQRQKTVVLGTSAEFAPYEFHKTIDGKDQIVGFDIDIAREIAKDMGVKLVIEDMSFDALLPALQSGRVDLVISGMTPTDERKQSIDFSNNYYQSKQVVMVRSEDKELYRTIDNLKGDKIGAQKGSIQEEIAQSIPGIVITSLDRIPDLVLQLQTKRVNAVILEDTVAIGYLQDRTVTLADAVPDDAPVQAAIGIRKGNKELLAQVNSTIARLKSENRIAEMVKQASQLSVEKQQAPSNIFTTFWEYRSYYALGLSYTLLLSALGVLFGFIIGLLISLLRMSGIRSITWLGTTYVEILRGTPMLVQLMIIHYGLALTLGINFTPLQSGIITLSLNSSAYLAEIFRAGIQGVDRGQMEAARSLGMGRGLAMRHIILPQAFKTVLPAIGNEFITIIKESSIISVIGMADIMYQAGIVKNITYKGLSPFIIAAAIYFVLTFLLSKLLGVWERRLGASDHR
ncbi:ABC transporter substrate-binding protein/permease [Paenibacillus thalictri]|uniref:Transporter substrate-binding domain-containing protein n=1 Tax=Paenibacillus thalictri TaxID=2527873 RepID=A0A4Q9DV01_9BACL|nr:ABC transporter substrate-binding protein/permease [Paenibacillus thalictri]TBL80809.1 transporter substrate-binding domain-containing protein [Paenibacillus thalictri]